MEANVFAGWIVRGMGGLATILERFADDKLPMNKTHLGELGGYLGRTVAAYDRLRSAADLEPGDRPPAIVFEGALDDGRIEQPAEPTASGQPQPGEQSTASEPAEPSQEPGNAACAADRKLRGPTVEYAQRLANGVLRGWSTIAHACGRFWRIVRCREAIAYRSGRVWSH